MTDTIKAVLFDLDGTLLDNDMDVFLPRYFERLAGRVAHILPPREFIAHLLAATQVMVANDGRATNEEVFSAAFYPFQGRSRAELEPILMDFYTNDFPELRRYTRRKPEARQLVQTALDLGCDVVIATNPLFPDIAVRHRLEWAGIADFPYRLVTGYENSRACKPNPLYYQGILEAIERPAAQCLMVGNEAGDMVAGTLGCATYLIPEAAPGTAVYVDPAVPAPTYTGTLAGVAALLLEHADRA